MHSFLPIAWIVTATLFLSFQVPAQEPPPRAEKALLLPVIQPIPDQLAAQAAGKRAAVFSINHTLAGGESSMNKGFFLDGSGLALCPLSYLCRDAPLRFDASDGEILAAPKVRAVFPARELALVKFAYKPKAWFEIADERLPPGEWIAVIGTLRDPLPPLGPVLAYRLHFKSSTFPETATTLSFATGRSPALARTFAEGAPVMDQAEQAAYLDRLGTHHSQEGDVAAAMDAYRKALELAPEISHACAANLAAIHAARGELEQAETLYRKAIAVVPERIDYLEGLQKILEKKGNGKLSTRLTDWIYQVEDLYRSR